MKFPKAEKDFLTFQELVISFLQNAVQANLQNADQRTCCARMCKNICQRHRITRFYEEAENFTSTLVDSVNPSIPHFTKQNKAFPNFDITDVYYGYSPSRRLNSIAIGYVQRGAGP